MYVLIAIVILSCVISSRRRKAAEEEAERARTEAEKERLYKRKSALVERLRKWEAIHDGAKRDSAGRLSLLYEIDKISEEIENLR